MKQPAYALKLAGAAALAGSSQAYGQIVVITPNMLPANMTNPSPSGTVPGAITNINDYYDVLTGKTTNTSTAGDNFHFGYFISGGGYFSQSYVTGLNTTGPNPPTPAGLIASVYVPSRGYLYADALSQGATIPGALQFYQQGVPGIYLTSVAADGTVATPSNFMQPNTDEYLGFQFVDGQNNVHNGWLELDSVTYPGGANGANLSGVNFIAGAYNSVAAGPNGAGDILVGEVPEPGTISSLVLGAAALVGVGLLRRRRSAFAAAQN
jgi:hypothetical protein